MRTRRQLPEPKVLSAPEVDDLARRLQAFCAGRPIVLLYLHGAHARGT